MLCVSLMYSFVWHLSLCQDHTLTLAPSLVTAAGVFAVCIPPKRFPPAAPRMPVYQKRSEVRSIGPALAMRSLASMMSSISSKGIELTFRANSYSR